MNEKGFGPLGSLLKLPYVKLAELLPSSLSVNLSKFLAAVFAQIPHDGYDRADTTSALESGVPWNEGSYIIHLQTA